MTENDIKEKLKTGGGRFEINMGLLEGNDDIRKPFNSLLSKQDQQKAEEIFNKRRKEEKERNDVMMGNMLVTTSGLTELVWTLHDLLYDGQDACELCGASPMTANCNDGDCS